jgi:hypothetical protein
MRLDANLFYIIQRKWENLKKIIFESSKVLSNSLQNVERFDEVLVEKKKFLPNAYARHNLLW